MPDFFEKNKIFFAVIIAGLLISGAIRSLNRPIYIPASQTELSKNNEVKNSAAQSATANTREENNSAESSSDQLKSPEPQADLYKVVKVVDGDTIAVDIAGKTKTIRLIGINTPETVDPRKPVECFGKEASNKAKEILTGKSVRLEADITQGERDKYGRLLRYAFLEDGTNFNKMMISEGFAYEYTYGTPYKYQDEFNQAEKEAMDAQKGLWAPGACDAQTGAAAIASAASPTLISSLTTVSNKYDCSGNIYNCSDFSTHAEAQAAFEACGGAANDIHRLDSDKDGLVCESLP
ncbi:thermonuclease family protein [Patescibacteria group bacterium]|nr:thermonuclease family protein [Patescibacteria group bacterium]